MAVVSSKTKVDQVVCGVNVTCTLAPLWMVAVGAFEIATVVLLGKPVTIVLEANVPVPLFKVTAPPAVTLVLDTQG